MCVVARYKLSLKLIAIAQTISKIITIKVDPASALSSIQ
jgi:hypothetical protein